MIRATAALIESSRDGLSGVEIEPPPEGLAANHITDNGDGTAEFTLEPTGPDEAEEETRDESRAAKLEAVDALHESGKLTLVGNTLDAATVERIRAIKPALVAKMLARAAAREKQTPERLTR